MRPHRTLQRDLANPILVNNLDFVAPWRNNKPLRYLVDRSSEDVESFLECTVRVVIPVCIMISIDTSITEVPHQEQHHRVKKPKS